MSYICVQCHKIKKIQKVAPTLRVLERQERESRKVLKELQKIKRSINLVSEDANLWLDNAISRGFDKQSVNDLFIKFDVVKKHVIGRFAVFVDPSKKNILVSEMRRKQIKALELKVRQFVRRHKGFSIIDIDNRIRIALTDTKRNSAEENLENLLIGLEQEVKESNRK